MREAARRFAPLQSDRAQALLLQSGHPASDLSTVILLIDSHAYFRSTAALMILRQLGGWPSALGIFGLVPVALRDFVYGFVAKNRHRWFPKSACPVPTARQREQFLA